MPTNSAASCGCAAGEAVGQLEAREELETRELERADDVAVPLVFAIGAGSAFSGCAVGFPRRSTGRFGSCASAPYDGDVVPGSSCCPPLCDDGSVSLADDGRFSTGRSSSPEEDEPEELGDAVGALPAAGGADDCCRDEDPRFSIGRSSLLAGFINPPDFFSGALLAALSGKFGCQLPKAYHQSASCRGMVVVKRPSASPSRCTSYTVPVCTAIGSGVAS